MLALPVSPGMAVPPAPRVTRRPLRPVLPGWAAAVGRGWGGQRGPARAAVIPLDLAGAAGARAGAGVGPRGAGAAALMWQPGTRRCGAGRALCNAAVWAGTGTGPRSGFFGAFCALTPRFEAHLGQGGVGAAAPLRRPCCGLCCHPGRVGVTVVMAGIYGRCGIAGAVSVPSEPPFSPPSR